MAFERFTALFRGSRGYLLLEQPGSPRAEDEGLGIDEKGLSTRGTSTEGDNEFAKGAQKKDRVPWLYVANLILFLILSGMLVKQTWPSSNDNNRKLQATSFFCESARQCWKTTLTKEYGVAPMFSRYSVDLVTKVVVGPLFNEDTLSAKDQLLRAYPSKRVDAAWKELTEVGVITISRDEVVRLGKDPDLVVKAHESLGIAPWG